MRLRLTTRIASLAVLTAMALNPAPIASDEGAGMRTEFGEVHLPNLAIGKTYSVTRLAAAPLIIRNTSDDTLNVQLEVAVPAHHELRGDALPLPNRRWVRLERSSFQLPAGASGRTDVHLTLPYDPDLAGKTYQVDFRPTNRDATGKKRGVGKIHRLLFTVEMDYRDDTEAQFTSREPRPESRQP